MTAPVAPGFTLALETPRLVLRPFGEHDVSMVCAALRANAGRLGRTGDETLTRTATWIAAERAAWERGERLSLVVLARDAARPSLWGHVSLSDRVGGLRPSATLGFWVDAAVEGRGIAYEALTCVVQFAFDTLGLRRLEALVATSNLRSQRVLDRLHFRPEALARGDHRLHVLEKN